MKTQLELSLVGKRNVRSNRARRRMPTARWWFEKMHQAVDHALDWTTPAARPQQIYLELKPAAGTRRGKGREAGFAREWVAS
jgi:hypothetical protein